MNKPLDIPNKIPLKHDGYVSLSNQWDNEKKHKIFTADYFSIYRWKSC